MQSLYALLVIDMQLCGFDGEITPPIEDGPALLDKVKSLIALSRSNQIPVIFIQHCGFPGQPYAEDMHGWEIHPSIRPEQEDRIVQKRNSSGFQDTDLEKILKQLGVEAVIVCGIQSEFCVTNTSNSALKLGFDVYLASDAHGTVSSGGLEAQDIVDRKNQMLESNGACVSDLKALRGILSLD